MKLAEALLLRADIQKKLASLQSRAQKYAFVQEGEKPAEDPNDILQQIDALTGEFQQLVLGINRTNLHHQIKTGESITEALAKRDPLALRHSILESIIEVCRARPERYGMKEIRWVTTINVATIQKQVDELAKHIRELNAAIQEAGWQIELIQ